ncbi:MAG: PA0069 family radical SAM protein [Bacteroidota bacterium]
MPQSHKGRGAGFNTPNRFEKLHLEKLDIEQDEYEESSPIPTQFFNDTTKSIIAKNESPDIPYAYSINPYRGCEHGCIYCYARPSHEYLGFSAGIDFESKILVKHDAPALLEEVFRKKSWKPEMIALCGNTDPYQPVERKLGITRKLLEVCLKYGNPVGVITKNFLLSRDLDILKALSALNLVTVTVSLTSMDADLIRIMEPRTAAPHKRLELIELLASNKIPTGVNIAPVIPGFTDEEIPVLLREAAARGATYAGLGMLRLPGAVEPLFLDWIQREYPDRAAKIINRIHDVRGGKLSDSRFGTRIKGTGKIAETIHKLFKLNCAKYGLDKKNFEFSLEHFRHNPDSQYGDQLGLF